MQISKQQKRYGVRFLSFIALVVSLSLGGRAVAATPKIGGGTCATSMVNGTYFYLLLRLVDRLQSTLNWGNWLPMATEEFPANPSQASLVNRRRIPSPGVIQFRGTVQGRLR